MIPLLGKADINREKFMGSHLMCICGCEQSLGECNHIHCPSSVPMRAELKEKLASGMTDDQIYAAFVDKYGTKVRASMAFRGWFNITAWLLSFAALISGAVALVFYLRRIQKATAQPAAVPTGTAYAQKIEDELNKFTPED